MERYVKASLLVLFLNLLSLLPSSACPYCPYPTPSPPPPKVSPPPPPPKVSPPPPPKSTPCPPPPKVKPPKVSPPPPPKVIPPPPPPPPPPKVLPPPPPKVLPPPPPIPTPYPPPPAAATCPIDTLKLGACVDLLGGLVHIGIGPGAEGACCPVLKGLAGLDAALCLCTTIRAKLLNINILLPIALELLVDCGKHPPSGFKCPDA